jgi:hypothetical protein
MVRSGAVRRFRYLLIVLALLVLVALLALLGVGGGRQSLAEARVTVAVEPELAWSLLSDLRLADQYVPGVARIEFRTPETRGEGVTRRVYQEGGGYLDETVVEWRPREGFLLRLHREERGPPFPFERAFFRYRLEPGDGGTLVTVSLMYEPRLGFLGRFLDDVLLNRTLHQMMEEVAGNLAQVYEERQAPPPGHVRG